MGPFRIIERNLADCIDGAWLDHGGERTAVCPAQSELRRWVIAFYDAKYTYNFWRPVTAIRAADTDNNRKQWLI